MIELLEDEKKRVKNTKTKNVKCFNGTHEMLRIYYCPDLMREQESRWQFVTFLVEESMRYLVKALKRYNNIAAY